MTGRFSSHNMMLSAPELETIELDKGYAISLNPQDSWDGVPSHLLPFITKCFQQYTQILHDTTLILCPEFSPIGKVHFHGWIYPHNHLGYMTTLQGLKILGTFCIKRILVPLEDKGVFDTESDSNTNVKTWDQYCFKQQSIIAPLFSSNRYSYPAELRPPEREPKL